MYGEQLAEIYDLVYRGRGKDFAAEATEVAEIVRGSKPNATSLLDVGCGTGEHLVHLSKLFEHVEGLELSAPMRAIAQEKLPGVPIHAGTMDDFDLGRTFDAVTCLFSTIAYQPSTEGLHATARCLARHLVPGGVVVIDPWWFPERFCEGYIAGDVVRDEDRTVARVSHSTRRDGVSRVEAHYLVADSTGIRHFVDTQLITLFTREEYATALRTAGCDVEYLPDRLSPRGVFVGLRR
ncbi:SAM-dependent methyltransferase [Carbonactinospora thermoautotrophica]|uniref:SAM-dependent methyltransferase n=2 Tax=Carbonactinospora thermoautotrophica TaxID=1469144 RepID=A0A132NER5_9ACTN|nr:class I SAM-dependent methyltransferase [Carbonactinospora thermoautotrophica]KWX05222.1 SAM-dependent methyltransferase [Carbonactinospora thermoautotrophica]KWX08615.1 SAM-dependent methyltransferase [Carbonactinospora thermoautotrophica]